jgi:hypothetical protein
LGAREFTASPNGSVTPVMKLLLTLVLPMFARPIEPPKFAQ